MVTLRAFAHGVGSRGDLPIPFWQFAWAAVAALAISFVALGVLWKQPRLAEASQGGSLGLLRLPVGLLAMLWRALVLALFVLVVVAALFGTDFGPSNVAPVTIYVAFWVGLQFLAAFIGDVWSRVSPFDSVVALLGGSREGSRPAPWWTGWLAPLGLLVFLVLELVIPTGSEPRTLGWWLLGYTMVMVGAGLAWGRDWLRTGDGFAVLFHLLGTMSPLYRTDDGDVRWRWPFAGLSNVAMTVTQLSTVLVVLGGTTFDGFAESEAWTDLVGRRSDWGGVPVKMLGLVFSIALVWVLYEFAVRFTATSTRSNLEDVRLAFGPSLVPIVFGYTVAHYAQLLTDEIQTFTFRLSDPFGRGWNVFGTANNSINFDVISVDLIAWVQVLAIVVGHIAAVAVAHDRAVERYKAKGALQSQYAMLFVMVLYSIAGLWLLMNA